MSRKEPRAPRFVPASDHTTRVERVLARTEAALASRDRALHWLGRANSSLGGRTPLASLETESGAADVARILGRIEHGVYS